MNESWATQEDTIDSSHIKHCERKSERERERERRGGERERRGEERERK